MAQIGILAGEDRLFTDAVIAAVNASGRGAQASYLTLDATPMNAASESAVIFDRASMFVPFYQSYLKNAALVGAYVTPDPFWMLAGDRFVAAAMAAKLGIWTARSILPPNHEHIEGVVQESLRNRKDPLDWAGAVAYLGLPLVVRGNRLMDQDSRLVSGIEGLMEAWAASGTGQLLLQEHVAGSTWLRAIVVGDEARVVPVSAPAYAGIGNATSSAGATADVLDRVAGWSVKATSAFGLLVNTIDYVVRDGYPYAIDLIHPIPDLSPAAIGEDAHAWTVEQVARRLIDLTADGAVRPSYRWQALMAA